MAGTRPFPRRALAALLAVSLLLLALLVGASPVGAARVGLSKVRVPSAVHVWVISNPDGCAVVPYIEWSAVKGADGYGAEIWDPALHQQRYWNSPETAFQFKEMAPPKGTFRITLAGMFGGGPCQNGAADGVGYYTTRFAKPPVVYAYYRTKDRYLISGRVTDGEGEPVAGQKLLVAGEEDRDTVTTGADGRYAILMAKGRYAVGTGLEDGVEPVASGDCRVAKGQKSCQVDLIRHRSAVSFQTPPSHRLLMTVKLGPYVHGPTYHDAVRAGYAFKIDATLRNTSKETRIVVPGESLWASLSGNAFDGHLQSRASVVYKAGAGSTADADAILSPDVVLAPEETRELSFVVRTQSLDVTWVEDVKAGGAVPPAQPTTVPAVAVVEAPAVGDLPEGPLARVKKTQVKWLAAGKAVKLKGDTCSGARCTFTLAVDDTAPEAPPWSTPAFAGELAAGMPAAILAWTWSTVRGLAWDMPNMAAAWGFNAIYVQEQFMEYWDAVENGPAGKEAFLRYAQAVKIRIDREHAEARFLADNTPGALQRIQSALRAHWTKVAEQYYAGDWHAAARTMSAEATKGTLDAVTLVAPAALARLSGITKLVEAVNARKLAAAEQAAAASAREAAAVTKAEIEAQEAAAAAKELDLLTDVESAELVRDSLPNGFRLTAGELEALGGFSREDLSAMNAVARGEVTGGHRIVQFWKGRSHLAAALKGFLGKPSWMKPKGIDAADVKYLGDSAADLGLQAWTEPPYLALVQQGRRVEAERQFVSTLTKWFAAKGRKLSGPEAKAAAERWALRVDEWMSKVPDQVRALLVRAKAAKANGGRTTVQWELEGNFADAGIRNEAYEVEYAVEQTTTGAADPYGPRTRYIPKANAKAGTPLTRVRSDHDALGFLYENGLPLTDADRMAVYRTLRERGVLAHPDTGSYAHAAVRDKILQDGQPLVTLGSDGRWVISRYNKELSAYASPGDYRFAVDGYTFVPNLP